MTDRFPMLRCTLSSWSTRERTAEVEDASKAIVMLSIKEGGEGGGDSYGMCGTNKVYIWWYVNASSMSMFFIGSQLWNFCNG